jgi:sRNA-binding regulator protein Hfq
MDRPYTLTRHEPEQRKVRSHSAPSSAGTRKSSPQEKTYAEEFYYRKQMQNRTPMVIRLTGEIEIRGWIEWYDRECIKVNRDNAPNLLVMKRYILYMYKADEENQGRNGDS